MTLNHMPSYLSRGEEIAPVTWRVDHLKEFESLSAYLKHQEKAIIQGYLKFHRGNISRASEDLGLSRQNLQYKMRVYDLK